MTRFELYYDGVYYNGIKVDVHIVSALRCPIPNQVSRINEFEDGFCLARRNDGSINACRRCWEQRLNENDLPEVAYVLACRYSDLGLTMIDFVHIGQIMLSNDCTFKEAVSRYYDQMAEYICKEE